MNIDSHVPMPTTGSLGRPTTEAGAKARALEPGQSVVCENKAEYSTVRKALWTLGRKYITRREGDGWRVWRKS